jgi:hypothetical protein
MDGFEAQRRQKAPSWSAFDIRMMFQGYLERGFVAEAGDLETLTSPLGRPPRRYEDFARETAEKWKGETRTTPPPKLDKDAQAATMKKAVELAPKYRSELIKPGPMEVIEKMSVFVK